jgi:predicted metal-dependent HD superfamily phosphohydrolase
LPLALPGGQLAALEAAYAQPPRAYHHAGHVAEVLRHYREVADGPGWQQPREVALAVLYHDAVYVPGRGDNEARSALLATAEVERWLPEEGIDVARVAALIELTARHGSFMPEDFSGAGAGDIRHFLDCDMAILGASPEAFDAYDAGIAEEYRGVVPKWIYRRKRRQFLSSLLDRERIYLSDFFHLRLEARARANLRRTLSLD